MPRIRMIKPEIFDDPDVGALSPLARWLFVGLLTQADRRGRLPDEPERLRLRLLGFDRKGDMEALLQELHQANMVLRYEHEGKAYLWVRSFEKHQRPHPREPESLIPAYSDETVKSHGEPGQNTSGRVMQHLGVRNLDSGVRNLEKGDTDGAPSVPSPRSSDFQTLWNVGTTPPIPRCLDLSDPRIAKIRLRLREHPLDWWQTVVARIEASAFCRGQNDRGWTATFDWLIANQDNALKVLEGKYDNRAPALPTASARAAPVYAESWCEHDPRCASPDVHALVLAREQAAQRAN